MRALFPKPRRALPPNPPRTALTNGPRNVPPFPPRAVPFNGPCPAPPFPPRTVPMNAPMGSESVRPLPPKGTSLHGRTLWSAMLDRYEFERHELAVLREFVRCADDLDRLAGAISRHGVITARGELNPAIAEARQLRIALAALVGALRLPAEHEDDAPAPIRRPQPYATVRRIDRPAPRSEANPVAVTEGRHSPDRISGRAAGVSVAELCARVQGRTPVAVPRAV